MFFTSSSGIGSSGTFCLLLNAYVLIRSEYWCEESTKLLGALEYHLGGQIRGVNLADIQFFPGEWRGYRGLRSAGGQGVGGRRVATYAVLSRVNRYVLCPGCRPRRDCDQLR